MKRTYEPNWDHQAFDEVMELGLDEAQPIVLNHSVALDIVGLLNRPYNDIDGATTLRNIRLLRKKGFSIERRIAGYSLDGTPREILVTQDEHKHFDFHRWDFSIDLYRKTGMGRIVLRTLMEHSLSHPRFKNIHLAKPELVLATKVDTGRENDAIDLDYAQSHGVQPMDLARVA